MDMVDTSPCYAQINIQIFCEISYLMYGYLIFCMVCLFLDPVGSLVSTLLVGWWVTLFLKSVRLEGEGLEECKRERVYDYWVLQNILSTL